MTSKLQERLGYRRPLAAALGLAALLVQPASAEMRVAADRVAPPDSADQRLAEHSRPSDDCCAEIRTRIDAIEQRTTRSGFGNRLVIGTPTPRGEVEDAVNDIIIEIIDGIGLEGKIGNRVVIGTSSDIAIGAGARACSQIGRVTCR